MLSERKIMQARNIANLQSLAIRWTKITDSVSSLPPQKRWILVAFEREGGVVLEACYDGIFYEKHQFHLRDGFTIYEGAVAWAEKPKYPKELLK